MINESSTTGGHINSGTKQVAYSSVPENTKETGRNADGTWKKGFCPNPGGRGRNPIKDYSLKEFNNWSDEQKQNFLKQINPFDRWRMTEGNPSSDDKVQQTVKIIIASEDETDPIPDDNSEGQPQV